MYPDSSHSVEKEYLFAPIFLYHSKGIMGEEAFHGFLSEVYQTYTNQVVHSEDILKILRSYNDSRELNDLIAFYFKESGS